jgi:hypothetical protein
MKRILLVAAAAGALAAPAFAQSASTCAEYMAADNAGRMAISAELEATNSQAGDTANLSSAAIQAKLDANCTAHPEMILIEVLKVE